MRSIILLSIFFVLLSSASLINTSDSIKYDLRFLQDTDGAIGELKNTTYTDQGNVSKIDDMDIYTVGTNSTGTKAIIMIYDIYGFNSGRTREICDILAAKGYFVILPDFYRGQAAGEDLQDFLPFLGTQTWEVINKDLTEKVYPYLNNKGYNDWAMVGACWGAWVVWEASLSSDKVTAGLSYHPSLANRLSVSYEEAGKNVKAPQLVVNTQNEPVEVKNNGTLHNTTMVSQPNSVFVTYEDVSHGYVTRGDINDATIKKRYDEALSLTETFLETNHKVNVVIDTGNTSKYFSMSGVLILIISVLLLN